MCIEQLRDFASKTEDGVDEERLGVIGQDILQDEVVKSEEAIFLSNMPLVFTPVDFEF